MKNIKLISIALLIPLLLQMYGCENADSHAGHNHAHEADSHTSSQAATGEDHEEEVHLRPEQVEAIGLETGGFTEVKIDGYFTANGTIDLPPQSIATVNAPETGFVKSIKNYVVGSYVKKGAVLAQLEHPIYIQKQQEYLETITELTWSEQELSRQKQLSEANVNALKAYQRAQADFNVVSARKKGLEQYLKFLGFDVAKLEKGEISSTIALRASLPGYLTDVNINKGMLVEPGMELYGIANNDHVHLELRIFEKDIAKVKADQRVTFEIPALGAEQFTGEIHELGRAFDPDNKSILAHCHITGKHPQFVRGLYAEAKIWIDGKTAKGLPKEAVVQDGGASYIFIKEEEAGTDEVVFKRILVNTGQQDDNFLEVVPVDSIPSDVEIVTKGAYYLISEMKKGESSHSH